MALAFAKIAFTRMRAAQKRMGSHDAYQAADAGETETVALSDYETEFIRARDSFYQGTVGDIVSGLMCSTAAALSDSSKCWMRKPSVMPISPATASTSPWAISAAMTA